MNSNDIQAIEEIFAKLPLRHLLFEVLVRCANDANVRPNRLISTHARKLAFLQHPQDLALHLEGHFSDFIEKERSVVALLETSDSLAVRAGERPFS